MNYVLEFYKGLDTVNLIIFWGIIIVVLLLLVFSIIIVNKNKKLERIIEANGLDVDDDNLDELAIKRPEETQVVKEQPIDIDNNIREIKEEITIKETDEKSKEKEDIPIKEERFIAEEHVREYNEEFFEIPTIKKQNEIENTIEETQTKHIEEVPSKQVEVINNFKKEPEYNVSNHNAPYQRNILREVYPSQMSPIGTIKKENTIKIEEKNKEVNETNNIEVNQQEKNSQSSDTVRYQQTHSTYKNEPKRGNYLEELSKKMSETSNNSGIDRTKYELEQEENAIISYRELVQKKDSIKTVDEEDAVISIEELKKRKEQEEKLYNITEKEPDDSFINELKNFRSDL